MSTLSEVNEGSTAWLTVSFYDKDGVLEVPNSIEWTVIDVASGAVLQSPTVVAVPASAVELTLTAVINAIQNASLKKEKRRVTVEAGFSGSEAQTKAYEYNVVNLAQIPMSP